MTAKHALLTAALLLLPLASYSCGGRSAKNARSASAPAQSEQCYERRASPDSSDDAEAAPASADSEGDYGDSDDYDDSCYTGDLAAEPAASGEEDEITRLWNEIRDIRLSQGLSGEPMVSETVKVVRLSVEEIQGQQEHTPPTSQLCIDICKIDDSICKNADRICRLADTLAGNEWAAEKCSSGKASCKEASQKCADCVAAEVPGESQ